METRNKWKRVCKALKDPMTIIPLVLGIIFGFLTFYINNEIKTLCTLISAIGLGIGINYFTFYYKEEKEKEILHFKAEHTVRSLNLVIRTILRRADKDSNENVNTNDSLLNIIDFWKDYYLQADTAQIALLKSLREQIDSETDIKVKTEKQNEYNSTVTTVTTAGLDTYVPLSGETKDQHIKYK